ncbi:MAG: alkylmercury lyase family protein [Actinomycetota bacterium]
MTVNWTDALTSAAIPRERWGTQRLSALTDGEREFYRWILKSFGAGTPPDPDELADAASRFELAVEPALERLLQFDLVHHDPATGAILVAYPFSGRPTAHRVRLDGHEVYAMCAIDALGIAPMLGEPIEIASRDPQTGDQIRVELGPGGHGSWRPKETVVVSGTAGGEELCESCCPVLNFFASPESAERWLGLHPEVRGTLISVEDAIAAGRAVFGDLLDGAVI